MLRMLAFPTASPMQPPPSPAHPLPPAGFRVAGYSRIWAASFGHARASAHRSSRRGPLGERHWSTAGLEVTLRGKRSYIQEGVLPGEAASVPLPRTSGCGAYAACNIQVCRWLVGVYTGVCEVALVYKFLGLFACSICVHVCVCL